MTAVILPTATLPTATLPPVTCDPAPLSPLSYSFVKISLDRFCQLGGLYHWFRSQGYTLPLASPKAFILEMVKLVMDETFFPSHPVIDLDSETGDIPDNLEDFSGDWPLLDFVCPCGLELEDGWDVQSELYRFCICLIVASNGLCRLDFTSYPYRSSAKEWWQQRAAEYDLPPLEEINWMQVLGRVEDLPEPYNGLGAILTWIDASAGNPFVDLSLNEIYQGGYEIDWDWDAESLAYLASEYAQAEADVFGPANHLDYLAAHDPSVLRTCIDLALGRCNALIWDGELILMDEGISLEGMPVDMAKLHVDPWVRYGEVAA